MGKYSRKVHLAVSDQSGQGPFLMEATMFIMKVALVALTAAYFTVLTAFGALWVMGG